MRNEGKEHAVELLQNMQKSLHDSGLLRYPQRSDFSEEEVVQIKAYLGPWPRALEAAGIKPPRDDAHTARRQEKRIAAKRRRTAAKIAKQSPKPQIHSDKGEKTS